VCALQEESLQRGHGQFVGRKTCSEGSGQRLLAGIEAQEHPLHLVLGGQLQLQLHVAAARPDERWIELLDVVGGHEQQPTFLGSHAVQRVQQAAEGHRRAASAPGVTSLGGGALHEDGVDVFQHDDGVLRRVAEVLCHRVVGQPLVREVQDADVQLQLARQHLREGSLAAARRTVQKIA
jgi:hypothetical protein